MSKQCSKTIDFEEFDLTMFQRHKISDEQASLLKCKALQGKYVVSKAHKCVALIYHSKDKSYYIYPFMSYARISKRIILEDTDETNLVIELFNGRDFVEKQFTAGIFSKFTTKVLYDFGCRFSESDIQNVVNYFLVSENEADIFTGYKKFGWITDKSSNLCYKGYKFLGSDNKYICQSKLDIAPFGCSDEWYSLIHSQVIGNTPMEFVLMSSFASAIFSLLSCSYDLGCVVLNLSNISSKGKTTTAMLAASVWGNPTLNRGTMISLNATENAIIDFVSNANSMTVVLDEATMVNHNDTKRLLYSVCAGRSKMRLDANSQQIDVKEFSNTIIVTAENNLISEDSPDGLKARIFEIIDPLTKTASQSDFIKKVILRNYGFAGSAFVKYLIKKGEQQIVNDYENAKTKLISYYFDEVTNSGFKLAERILSKLAVIFLATIYCNELFSFEIDKKAIKNYIVKIVSDVDNIETPEEKILSIVYQDFLNNLSRFKFDFNLFRVGGDVIDRINTAVYQRGCLGLVRINKRNRDYFDLCVLEEHFKELMKKHHIQDFRKRLRVLRDKGILSAQKDRNVSSVDILSPLKKVNAYVFKFHRDGERIEWLDDKLPEILVCDSHKNPNAFCDNVYYEKTS